MSPIFEIVFYLGISIVLLVAVQVYLYNLKAKNEKTFNDLWPLLNSSVKNGDLDKVCFYGSKLLWNPFMNRAHYDLIVSYLNAVVVTSEQNEMFVVVINELYISKGWSNGVVVRC